MVSLSVGMDVLVLRGDTGDERTRVAVMFL